MQVVGQAYIHLKPYSTREERIAELRDVAERISVAAALRHYETRALVLEIELEEGSLKARIGAVAVSLVVILEAAQVDVGKIADYKAFKQGIVNICKDARGFGGEVCDKFAHLAG